MPLKSGRLTDPETYEATISPDSLRDLPEETQVRVMVHWFFERYEDPAHRTPYETREGGYQWIWGGPYSAKDELYSEFHGFAAEELIERAIEEIQSDGIFDWAPVPSPDDYDDDRSPEDDLAPSPVASSEEQFRRSVVERLDELRAAIDELKATPGVGHNNPPGPISDAVAAIDGLRDAADIVRNEASAPVPDRQKAEKSANIFRSAFDVFKSAVRRLAEEKVKQGLSAGAEAIWPHLVSAAERAADAIVCWISSLPWF